MSFHLSHSRRLFLEGFLVSVGLIVITTCAVLAVYEIWELIYDSLFGSRLLLFVRTGAAFGLYLVAVWLWILYIGTTPLHLPMHVTVAIITIGIALFFLLEVGWDQVVLPVYAVLRLYRYSIWFTAALVFLLGIFIVTLPGLWEQAWANRLVMTLIFAYVYWDKQGRWYYRLRRLAFLIWAEEQPSARYVTVLKGIIEEARLQVDQHINQLEIARLNNQHNDADANDLHAVGEDLAVYQQVLANHYRPQYRDRQGYITSESQLLTSALLLHDLWLTGETLRRLKCALGENEHWPDPKVTIKRAIDLYKLYTTLPSATNSFITEFIHCHVALATCDHIDEMSIERVTKCVKRLLLSDHARPISVDDHVLFQLTFKLWIERLAVVDDYQAIIQACDLIMDNSTLDSVLDKAPLIWLGYAWWQYAINLGIDASGVGRLAWQTALHSFMMAHYPEAINELNAPFEND